MSEKRVLIVEDDPDACLLVEMELSEAGYDVVTQDDGKEALEFIKSEAENGNIIDLIVLDLNLPSMYGMDIAKELYQNSATKHIPIIILSVMPKSGNNAEYSGNIKHYLQKPCNMAVLIAKTKELIS